MAAESRESVVARFVTRLLQYLGRIAVVRNLLYCLEQLVFYVSGQTSKGAKNEYLSGNYGPVLEERQEANLTVIGQLPKDLDGVFVRIGPNPALQPVGDYHWFDGDGMLHAIRIKDGKASYANRFAKTSRLLQERAAGFPLFMKFGDSVGWLGVFTMLMDKLKGMLGVCDKSAGAGTANTALVFHAKKLLALHEGDLPYQVRVLCNGVLDTLGRLALNNKWKYPFTAHPKLDNATGELHFFGYQFNSRPYAQYGRLSREGELVASVPVDISAPVMMHDMGLAGDYVIIIDCCLAFKPEVMVTKGMLPFEFDKSRPTRFGLLPKNATSPEELRWFEAPPAVMFHTAAAWQEGHVIKLYTCVFGDEFTLQLDSDVDPVANAPCLTEYTFDLSSRETAPQAAVRRVSEVTGDFPQIPWERLGDKVKYAYLAHTNPKDSSTKMVGVAKVDLQAAGDGKVGIAMHGPHVYGGEAFFVSAKSKGPAAEEDDGYLAVLVHDESKGDAGSELRVYDARTMSSDPVARVLLPHRVPYGFHCIHVPEDQLRDQAVSL